MIINKPDIFDKVIVRETPVTDHYVITCNLLFDKPQVERRQVVTRNIKAIDSDKFKSDLSNQKLDIVPSSTQDMYTVYHNSLSALIDLHAPLRTRSVTDRPSAPWMSSEVKTAKTECRRAERQWRKSGLQQHKEIFYTSHLKVKNVIAMAKRNFYEQSIAIATSSKTLFRIVSNFYGKSKSCIFPNVSSLHELVEMFSNYFIDKICTLRTTLDQQCSSVPIFEPFNAKIMCTFKPVSVDYVRHLILTSSPKSCADRQWRKSGLQQHKAIFYT